MPKKQKDSLNEEQNKQRDEILNILYLNCAHCLLKKKMYKEGIKQAHEALLYIENNPKAYYRIAMAYKEQKDYDRAQENLKKAIELSPNSKDLREEYARLQEIKRIKEKERFQEVSGFLNTKALENLKAEDEQEAMLKEKIKRKTFHDGI